MSDKIGMGFSHTKGFKRTTSLSMMERILRGNNIPFSVRKENRQYRVTFQCLHCKENVDRQVRRNFNEFCSKCNRYARKKMKEEGWPVTI